MDFSSLFAICIFAFVMSVTPGPNNIMLLASGAQFGYQRTLPHMFGIILGMASLLACVLFGFAVIFQHYPALNDLLKVFGSLYLLFLAWKIASAPTHAGSLKQENQQQKPMSLINALLFQYANPKAWAMCIGSISTFTLAGDAYITSGLWIMLCFAITGFVAISLWAYLGEHIASYLNTSKQKKIFNYCMGLMTVMTLYFILN